MYIVQRLRGMARRRLERQSLDLRIQCSYIADSLNRVGGLLGLNVFTPDYSPTNLVLRLILVNTFIFFWINLYNLTTTYGNLVEFMYCFETLLYVGVVCIKLQTFVMNRTLIVEMYQYMVRFFAQFYGDPEQDELLIETLQHTTVLGVLFGVCCSLAAGFMFIFSLFWSLLVEYVLPFGFFIPSVGTDYLEGFAFNYVFQLFETTLLMIGTISSEGAFFMFLANACLQVDMLRLQLKRYSKGMCKLFELHFFVVFSCIFCQLVSIVVVIVSVPNWYPGYFQFIMLTAQLFFSCALGQIFNIKCDELTIAIYNVPWYSMEVRDQKAMRLLLMASQHPGKLSYGFGTVNMRAFFEIYRKTYSIGMMLLKANVQD
uniref:Uncharacterized protein n=1 Tax=Anopheles epiroticus TaxID=199890 RepID=A0A182P6Z3_9DIPT